MSGGARPLAVRLYGAWLHLYPADFRETFGREMLDAFAERVNEAGRAGGSPAIFALSLRELAGLSRYALSQHLVRWFRRGRSGRRLAGSGPGPRSTREALRRLPREIRQALRRLAGQPGFTSATVATLGLGIGATTAIFSLVYSIVISPLPHPDSDRIVWLDHGATGVGVESGLDMTRGLYNHYSRLSRTLDELAVYTTADASLTGDGEPERLQLLAATYTLFEVLRVAPLLGRTFEAADDYSDGAGVVVLTDEYWKRRFGGDPAALGRSFELNGTTVEIVGVMPPGFAFPDTETRLLVPLVVRPDDPNFGGFSLRGIARLSPGATPPDVETELAALIPRLPESFPPEEVGRVVSDAKLYPVIRTLKEHTVGDAARTLFILLATVSFVLLIACANVANLFLVRAEVRSREVAVRTALGAGRGDMARHFLLESLVLAGAGGALGALLAHLAVRTVVGFGPENLPRLAEVGIDLQALGFAAATSIVAALVFSMIPLARRTTSLAATLADRGRGSSRRRTGLPARQTLIAAQMALALVLLVGAGLMVRSFRALKRIDLGFVPESALSFELGVSRDRYPDREAAVAFHERLLRRIEALPGVESAAITTCQALCGSYAGDPLRVEGRNVEEGVIPPVVAHRRVSAGYFETMGIRLREGRTFVASDHERRTGAAVISARIAELYFGDEDPIGRRIYRFSGGETDDWYTIVGVVDDIPIRELTESGSPSLYMPLLHTDSTRGPGVHSVTYVTRTSVPPTSIVPAIRSALKTLDPGVPIARVQTVRDIVDAAGIDAAFAMVMLSIAAAVALSLGLIGIYAVIAYAVAQRTGEIGVRMALGARAADVSRMVVGQAGTVASIGLAIGLLGAFALTRFMKALLYGVSATDPATLAVVSALLLGLALAAGYVPARRAGRIDPMDALRNE